MLNVSVAGSRIELLEPATFATYLSNAPPWMTNIVRTYGGNPYRHLVEMATLAQQDGVIRGVLLHQGNPTTTTRVAGKGQGIYERLLRDLNLKAEVPLLAGGLVPADQKGVCGYEPDHC